MKTRSQQLLGFVRVWSGLTILVLLLATAGSVSALSTVDTIHTGVGLIVVQFPDSNLWAGDAHGITQPLQARSISINLYGGNYEHD
jgi:hypothetical protein